MRSNGRNGGPPLRDRSRRNSSKARFQAAACTDAVSVITPSMSKSTAVIRSSGRTCLVVSRTVTVFPSRRSNKVRGGCGEGRVPVFQQRRVTPTRLARGEDGGRAAATHQELP